MALNGLICADVRLSNFSITIVSCEWHNRERSDFSS